MSFVDETGLELVSHTESDFTKVSGLTYIPSYITVDEQNELIGTIDQQEWSIKSKRRVQHYGYRYEYKDGLLASSSYLGDLPDWVNKIAQRLSADGLTKKAPDQVIVNEYEPGQGITSHVDCVPCFGNTIISLSLGSSCAMDFTSSQATEKISILLNPQSLVIMQGAARYEWQHGIPARKKDKYKGIELLRERRISMTFREVLFPYK